jgi:hypothetical protein
MCQAAGARCFKPLLSLATRDFSQGSPVNASLPPLVCMVHSPFRAKTLHPSLVSKVSEGKWTLCFVLHNHALSKFCFESHGFSLRIRLHHAKAPNSTSLPREPRSPDACVNQPTQLPEMSCCCSLIGLALSCVKDTYSPRPISSIEAYVRSLSNNAATLHPAMSAEMFLMIEAQWSKEQSATKSQ